MLKRPLAAVPLTIEGLLFAALILFGWLPAEASVAPAAAVFPFDLYFDLKQSVAFSSGWVLFGVSVAALVLFRTALLALTAAFADGRGASLTRAYRAALMLGLRAVPYLFPAAALYFIAVATRYAPFAWIAALIGFFPAWRLCRRGVGLDTGIGTRNGPVPEISSFFLYAALLMGLGASISALAGRSVVLAALIVAGTGPLHAAVWLGWRWRSTESAASSEGRVVTIVAFVLVAAFFISSVIDRNLREFRVVPADYEGSLLLLGGVDSTRTTGALADFEPGALGYARDQSSLLSYRGSDRPHRAADTRGDLDKVALRVQKQIEMPGDRPRVLLGHSQASLILDRILETGDLPLDASAVISPAPPVAPSIDVPPEGEAGEGRVGGDSARAFADLLEIVNLTPYDVDAPASPTNLHTLRVRDARVPRLAVWALGDSVLLETDWRRPGETNLVALSDHVGAPRNPRALEATRLFLQGRRAGSDESSWRSVAVNLLRYAFEPWRP